MKKLYIFLRGVPEERRNNKTPKLRFSAYIFFFFVGISRVCAQDIASVKTFCRLLPEYHEPAGVEYQPGVGPDGPVAPADLPGQPVLHDFDTIEIPVVADLIKKFDPPVPWGTELKPDVALISIHNDGQVDYNGHDISQQAYELCQRVNTKDKKQ